LLVCAPLPLLGQAALVPRFASPAVCPPSVVVLKKQPDGSWKIARDVWNEAVKR
jgi:hypothetical protein